MRYIPYRSLLYWFSSFSYDTSKSTAFIATTVIRRTTGTIDSKRNMVFAAATPTGTSNNNNFTTSRSIPKKETKVLDLWQRNPKADGRGVKIAVFDTGCDLAAAGLQTTSNGLPKYINFLDCTGDGDIDTTAVVTVPEPSLNNDTVIIKGKSGRELTLGDWAPKAGSEVRLGSIRLYDVIPRSVKGRLIREKKAAFEDEHHRLMAQMQQNLDELQSQIDSCSNADEKKKKQGR